MCEYQKKKYYRNIKGEDEKEAEDQSALNEMSESRMSHSTLTTKASEKTEGCPFRLVYKCKVNESK